MSTDGGCACLPRRQDRFLAGDVQRMKLICPRCGAGKRAALEIVEACRNPPSLIDHLARLVSRKQRPGVVSDTWSYRNQLIVLFRGYSEARGFYPWANVGRKVQKGQKAFYIMAPHLVPKKDDKKNGAQKAKPKKKRGGKKAEQEKVLVGYRAVPVFGLEQTEPAEDWKEEERYHPFGEGEGTVRVFNGYRQPWYRWYEKLLTDTLDELTALLGAAVVAKLFNQATELQDLLNKLGTHPVEEVAERIDRSCRAVAAFLEEEGIPAGEARRQEQQ